MYKRILVAVDGSENSKRAAEHAAAIASWDTNAHVEILFVLDYDRTRTDFIPNIETDDLHFKHQERLAPIKGTFEKKRIAYELVIKQGDPGITIVSFANRGGFDLVVIGSRGLNSFQEMVLGSVSHKVARKTKAPVMIVK